MVGDARDRGVTHALCSTMVKRDGKVACQVKAAAILGLAIKLVVSADCTDEVPVSRLWAKVTSKAHVALVKALEIQLVNQWPGLE